MKNLGFSKNLFKSCFEKLLSTSFVKLLSHNMKSRVSIIFINIIIFTVIWKFYFRQTYSNISHCDYSDHNLRWVMHDWNIPGSCRYALTLYIAHHYELEQRVLLFCSELIYLIDISYYYLSNIKYTNVKLQFNHPK